MGSTCQRFSWENGRDFWVVATQIFFFTPNYLGEWSNLRIIFSNGLVQPPTRFDLGWGRTLISWMCSCHAISPAHLDRPSPPKNPPLSFTWAGAWSWLGNKKGDEILLLMATRNPKAIWDGPKTLYIKINYQPQLVDAGFLNHQRYQYPVPSSLDLFFFSSSQKPSRLTG